MPVEGRAWGFSHGFDLSPNLPIKTGHPHEPPGKSKNYGADINTLIELIDSGKL